MERYHRVLNRARWSGWQAAKSWLGLVIQWLPAHGMPVLVVDDTVERRWGKRIEAKGCYREAVRSTGTQVVKCVGLKWLNLRVWVPLTVGFLPVGLTGVDRAGAVRAGQSRGAETA